MGCNFNPFQILFVPVHFDGTRQNGVVESGCLYRFLKRDKETWSSDA